MTQPTQHKTKAELLKAITRTLKGEGYGRGWHYEVKLWRDLSHYRNDPGWRDSIPYGTDRTDWREGKRLLKAGMVIDFYCLMSIRMAQGSGCGHGEWGGVTLHLVADPTTPDRVKVLTGVTT